MQAQGTILSTQAVHFMDQITSQKPDYFSKSTEALEPGSSLAQLPGCFLLLPAASSSPKPL